MEQMLTPEMGLAVADSQVSWINTSYDDVVEAATATPSSELTEFHSRAFVLQPETRDFDETKSVALALPHLNGWTPHHYIRAKVMQQVVCPDNRLIVFPNNSFGQTNYDLKNLNDKQVRMFENGSMKPVAIKHMRTLEELNRKQPLGSVALSGYSLGGNIVLSMANLESDSVEVTNVNADETPSKVNRMPSELKKDFMQSGGVGELRSAIQESEIDALMSAMRINRMALDLARFGIKSLGKDAKLVAQGMSDSIGLELLSLSGKSDKLQVKLGYVEGSRIFDPTAISKKTFAQVTAYGGKGFHKHASGDNPYVHALMANDGLNPTSRS